MFSKINKKETLHLWSVSPEMLSLEMFAQKYTIHPIKQTFIAGISFFMANKERVIAYIDGFNLYFGMLEMGSREYSWLNIQLLAQSLLKPNQELVGVKYFTSRVSNNPEKQRRQTTYIEAIESLDNCSIYYGKFQANTEECYGCGRKYSSPNEKMTDVNIAVEMLTDAYADRYDMAMLISGDSDLIPPIKSVHSCFPKKRVFVAFPPNRHNSSIALVAKGSMILGRAKLKAAQFPPTVVKENGFELKRPSTWL